MKPIGLWANKELTLSIPRKRVGGKEGWLLPIPKAHPGKTWTLTFFLENLGLTAINDLEITLKESYGVIIEPLSPSIPRLRSTDIAEIDVTYTIPDDAKPGTKWATIKIHDEQLILRFNTPDTKHPLAEAKPGTTYVDSLRKTWSCSFYEDRNGKRPITHVDFGDVWENESSTKNVWVRNDDQGLIKDMEYIVYRDDVAVSGPPQIKQGEAASLQITWTPGDNPPFGLNDDLRINGTLVRE